MALESVVFQQGTFINYGYKDVYNYDHGFEEDSFADMTNFTSEYLDSSLMECASQVGGAARVQYPVEAPTITHGRRKRRHRSRNMKNEEEIESQRMTHIKVERNRRKQMNEYLAVIRSLMPPSYAIRGDQASIVGGAINFVKELEQFLQYLQAQSKKNHSENNCPNVFANFFTFPQYSTHKNPHENSISTQESIVENPSTVADVEVAMVESHANIKILSRKQPKQLLKLISGFFSLGLNILHLNVTTVDDMAFYSFSVKVGDESQLGTVDDMAKIIHEMMRKIQEVPISSYPK